MSYNLRNYRHRNPKGGDDKKTSSPFFKSPQKATVRKKKQGGFFQAKLAVGQPGDSHEKEADAMASQVTKQNAAGVQKKEMPGVQRLATSKEDEKLGTNDARMEKDKEEPMKPLQAKEAPEKGKKEEKDKPVQKKEAPEKKKEKPVQKKGKGEEKKKKKGVQKSGDAKKEKPKGPAKEEKKEKKEEAVQKKDEGEKEKKKPVQKKEAESTTSDAVAEEIKKQSGKGSPLPPKVLAEMNKSFGVDFSNVRIHHDMAAVKLCQELHAMAFTHGQDIFFNEGKYNPESAEGKMLLAHELTHVVQQANSIDV